MMKWAWIATSACRQSQHATFVGVFPVYGANDVDQRNAVRPPRQPVAAAGAGFRFEYPRSGQGLKALAGKGFLDRRGLADHRRRESFFPIFGRYRGKNLQRILTAFRANAERHDFVLLSASSFGIFSTVLFQSQDMVDNVPGL